MTPETIGVITEIALAVHKHGESAVINLMIQVNDPLVFMLPGMFETQKFFARMKYRLIEDNGRMYLEKK